MRDILLMTLTLALVAAIALAGLFLYSRHHAAALSDQTVYASPEEGMRAMAQGHYVGLKTIEIVHAGYEPCFLSNLYFVEARVWADDGIDGKVDGPEGDNLGGFFLRRGDGWIWIPESRRPWFVALGQRLFGEGS